MDTTSQTSFLGQHLLEQGLISPKDLQKAEAVQKSIGGRFSSILMRLGAISEDSLLQVLSELMQMPLLKGPEIPEDPLVYIHAVEQCEIDLDWWIDQETLIWEHKDELRCAARDFLSNSLYELLTRTFPDRKVVICLVSTYELERRLDAVSRARRVDTGLDGSIENLRELAEEAPVIEFVNNLLSQAYEQRASDVHVEPCEHQMEARFRIDGVLYSRFTLPKERFPAISSRIKLISGLDISERRLPQDGRISLRLGGEEVDLRVSTAPGVHGESIVLRLLPKEKKSFSLADLGFAPDHFEQLERLIREPHGILLVTGPTGSGKSTTLYAALDTINDKSTKIITVEDPVEFQLDGITQLQTHAEIGYTFARALRSILRQDPDVVMIGEIRDKETAEIAVQASLTGHMVLSTLHTNDSVSAFTRLIDMGIEPFLVATPVRAVMAQRLVRRLCPKCSQPTQALPEMEKIVHRFLPEEQRDAPGNWKQPKGCPACQGTGYQGRIGIYELVEVTPEIQDMILTGSTTNEMRSVAQKTNRMLRDDGLLKAWAGQTSIDEVLRITAE